MAAILDIVLMLIMGAVGLLVWGYFYAELCTTIIGSAGMAMLGLVSFFLSVILVVRMLVGGLTTQGGTT